jgi:hypothetical protein
VAAKIAYGLFTIITGRKLDDPHDTGLRRYILDPDDSLDEPVSEMPWPEQITTSTSPHWVLLFPSHDPDVAIVSLYGRKFKVDLISADRPLSPPVAVICEINGTGMRKASSDEIQLFAEDAKSTNFSLIVSTQRPS